MAIGNRQGVLENSLTFTTSTTFNKVEAHAMSELLKRVLQEMPEGQKQVINLASKGMSRREITVKSKISSGRGKLGNIWL